MRKYIHLLLRCKQISSLPHSTSCSFHQNPDNLIHLPSPSSSPLYKPNLLPLLPRTPMRLGPHSNSYSYSRIQPHLLLPIPPLLPTSASNIACLASSSCSLYRPRCAQQPPPLFTDGVCDAETAIETVEETDEATR